MPLCVSVVKKLPGYNYQLIVIKKLSSACPILNLVLCQNGLLAPLQSLTVQAISSCTRTTSPDRPASRRRIGAAVQPVAMAGTDSPLCVLCGLCGLCGLLWLFSISSPRTSVRTPASAALRAGRQQTGPASLAVATRTAMLGSTSTTTQKKSLCVLCALCVSVVKKSRLVIIIV